MTAADLLRLYVTFLTRCCATALIVTNLIRQVAEPQPPDVLSCFEGVTHKRWEWLSQQFSKHAR